MHFRSTRKLSGELSLSDTIETDGDGNGLSFIDILCVEDDMLDTISARESCMRIRECVAAVLSERERSIITLRYGLSGLPPQTQRDVASQLGISRSYVSRLEKRALKKLRDAFQAD